MIIEARAFIYCNRCKRDSAQHQGRLCYRKAARLSARLSETKLSCAKTVRDSALVTMGSNQ